MSILQIILAWAAFLAIGGLFVAAVLGRLNGIKETDEDEPIGDMVDVKSLIQKWED